VFPRKTLIALWLLGQSAISIAESLPVNDLNPFLSGYDLPTVMPASLNPARLDIMEINYSVSNISLDQQTGIEHAIADAELHRWQMNYTHSINQYWSLRMELPYQSISGGSLDSFIEHFHRSFNLPNGNRQSWPRDRLLMDYSRNASNVFHLDDAQSGLGDVALRVGWNFDASIAHSTSLWFGLKLPTGNAAHLTGSGSVDASVALSAEQTTSENWIVFEQASLSLLGHGSPLSDEQKHIVWSGAAGADWKFITKMEVIAQLQLHTAIFDSQLKILGTATQFSIGPRYHGLKWQASLSIAEDIVPDTAPDVQFQFDLLHRF